MAVPAMSVGTEFVLFSEVKMTTVNDKMKILDNWNFSGVERFMREREGYTDAKFLAGLIDEYRKFMAISAVHATIKNPVIMSSVVDPVWHAHILFTRDYRNMCNAIADGYLNHEPAFPDELSKLGPGYEYTLRLYLDSFGVPPKEYWPDFAQICGTSGCACSGPGNE